MSIIKLDAGMTNQFAASKFATVVCADDGKPLGFFLPPDAYKKLVYRAIEVPFSKEELDRRSQIAGGCSITFSGPLLIPSANPDPGTPDY